MRQLQTLPIRSPGSLGLNLSKRDSLLPAGFSVRADHTVIDDNGRLAARGGLKTVTTTPVSVAVSPGTYIRTLFERIDEQNNTSLLLAFGGGVSNSFVSPEANVMFDGGVVADPNWAFYNFNNKVIGFRPGFIVSYTGTGTGTSIVVASGVVPRGGIGTVAFGRVWGVDSDFQVLRGSALLDETRWAEVDGGVIIDMSSVWPGTQDRVVAVAAFNGALVVFGENNIVFWVDGQGSALGLDPTLMYVSDVITGVGCYSQHTIQHTGTSDLLFFGQAGIQSLRRLINERSAPLTTLTPQVRDDMLKDWFVRTTAAAKTSVKSLYSEKYGFYILSFPLASRVWILDVRTAYTDQETGRPFVPVTSWPMSIWALLSRRDGSIFFSTGNVVKQYDVIPNDDGSTFALAYESPWLDMGEEASLYEKLVKRVQALVYTRGSQAFTLKFAADFDPSFEEADITVNAGSVSQWGDTDPPGPQAEWGPRTDGTFNEWGAGVDLVEVGYPLRGRGQYIKIGLDADINTTFAIQQMDLTAKMGRMS